MGIRISAQLLLFVQSVLLGLGSGAVYGALRPLRRLRPGLAAWLDLLYALSVAAAGAAFLLRPADGILRGYAVLGALGGAALWLCGFDETVRPLWTFWTETAALLTALALLPVRLTLGFLRFLLENGKSLFYFLQKCGTIQTGFRRSRHSVSHRRRNSGVVGGTAGSAVERGCVRAVRSIGRSGASGTGAGRNGQSGGTAVRTAKRGGQSGGRNRTRTERKRKQRKRGRST